MAGPHVFFQCTAELYPIHFRHHQIGDDNVRNHLCRLIVTLFPVLRLADRIVWFKELSDVPAEVRVILDDEHNRPSICRL